MWTLVPTPWLFARGLLSPLDIAWYNNVLFCMNKSSTCLCFLVRFWYHLFVFAACCCIRKKNMLRNFIGFQYLEPRPISHVDIGQTPVISFLNAAFGQPRHQKSPANTTGPRMNLCSNNPSFLKRQQHVQQNQELQTWDTVEPKAEFLTPTVLPLFIYESLDMSDKSRQKPTNPEQKSQQASKKRHFSRSICQAGSPAITGRFWVERDAIYKGEMCIVDGYAGFYLDVLWM